MREQAMSIDSYYDCVHWHTMEIADLPLKVLDWPHLEYYYDNGYSAKQCAFAALVNDFGLNRLLISNKRIDKDTKKPEVRASALSLMIAAYMPFVNPTSDIDPYMRKGHERFKQNKATASQDKQSNERT